VTGLNNAMRAHPGTETGFEMHAELPVAMNQTTGWRLAGANGTYVTVSYDPR